MDGYEIWLLELVGRGGLGVFFLGLGCGMVTEGGGWEGKRCGLVGGEFAVVGGWVRGLYFWE